MREQIEQFYQIINNDKIQIDEIELAEILWLAEQIKEQSHAKQSLMEILKKRVLNFLDRFHGSKKRETPQNTTTHKKSDDSLSKPSTQQQKRRRTKKRANTAPLVASSNKNQKSLPFRTPVNRYIDNDNSWIYALRHFKQKKPIRDKALLDEERTADYIASNRIYAPQYQIGYEKRFEVVFILDTSSSMEIWRELIDEFFKSIKNYGIFKNFTVYYMEFKSELILYKNIEKKQTIKPSWYRNRLDETLCFVLSDMLSAEWQSGIWLKEFEKWQKRFALSIVQMLPYHLWRATILNYATLTKLEGQKPFGKNIHLKSRARLRDTNQKVIKIPILNLNADSFDAYGKLFVAKAKNRIDGAIFKIDKINYENIDKEQTLISDEERVKDFYKIASNPAKELAEYFAVIPLSFPVMKIVQQELLPHTTQVHLSELFMSGLIDKQTNRDKIYRFFKNDEGVREILLNLLGISKAIETIVRISEFIAKGEGAFDFLAFLRDPNYLNESGVSSELDREFARISATLLKKMGGEYAQKADELIEYFDEYEYEEIEELQTITPLSKRFIMGSEDGRDSEKPAHEVIINYDFEISPYPVTVGEFRVFVEETGYVTEAERGDGAWVWDGKDYGYKKDANWKNPYFKQTDDHPVVCVSWNDAQAYIEWLNKESGESYRLPTEAEWEFACRAGTTTKWYFGDSESELKDYAWYRENSDKKTYPVGEKKPNQWGLYDMHGNVWEWCLDDWSEDYKETPIDGSANHSQKEDRKSLRGGSWFIYAFSSRSAIRVRNFPTNRVFNFGFRLLRTLP